MIEVELNQVKTDVGNGDPIFSTTIIDNNYMRKKLDENMIMLDQIQESLDRMGEASG